MEKIFKRFALTTNLDEKGINYRNSITYVQIIGDNKEFPIFGKELCYWHADAFLNGDEEEILDAIKSIWKNRQINTDLLKGFYYGVIR